MSLSPLSHLLLAAAATVLVILLINLHDHFRNKNKLFFGSRLLLELVFTVLVADLFCLTLMAWFTYTPSHNPLFLWILENLAGTKWYKPLVLAQDMIQHFVIALPFAYLLLQIRPLRLFLKSVTFMMALLIFCSWPIVVTGKLWLEWEIFLLSNTIMLPILPITLYLLARKTV